MTAMTQRLRALPLVRWSRQVASRRHLLRLHRALVRMPTQIREVTTGRVLVVAPHMDDEVIAAGGTLVLHRAVGSRVCVAFVSDSGGPHAARSRELSSIRRREAAAVARYVGFELEHLGFQDGALTDHERRIGRVLAGLIERLRPDVILCPFSADGHADHQASAMATSHALEMTAWQGEVWAYEVWTPIWPNVGIDITTVAERKREAIALYRSQMQDRDYATAVLGLNQYRGLQSKVGFVESFHVSSPATFRRITATLRAL